MCETRSVLAGGRWLYGGSMGRWLGRWLGGTKPKALQALQPLALAEMQDITRAFRIP